MVFTTVQKEKLSESNVAQSDDRLFHIAALWNSNFRCAILMSVFLAKLLREICPVDTDRNRR